MICTVFNVMRAGRKASRLQSFVLYQSAIHHPPRGCTTSCTYVYEFLFAYCHIPTESAHWSLFLSHFPFLIVVWLCACCPVRWSSLGLLPWNRWVPQLFLFFNSATSKGDYRFQPLILDQISINTLQLQSITATEQLYFTTFSLLVFLFLLLGGTEEC